ncbi:MAG TPA: hypothetical protein VLJ39_14645, partial [Tepidisphaeraceae bacterium]|nr:hypothetical protein [Tepidisphaeraceae bacterium]
LVISGTTSLAAHQALDDVRSEQLLSKPVRHKDDADAALAGLWLWLDAFEESHTIAQDIVSTTGSFWHAILHRREGDFSNAKYWYRRCDTHHVNKLMGAIASSVAGDLAKDPAVAHAIHQGWNPIGFVDLVQAVQNKPSDPRHALAVRLQRAEWEALFDYCVRAAVEADTNNLDAWDNRLIHPAGEGDSSTRPET